MLTGLALLTVSVDLDRILCGTEAGGEHMDSDSVLCPELFRSTEGAWPEVGSGE